ncbi:DUF4382 domain-containing protein [Catenovulum agarivorans]|uniref:DUF4382 domain-containing protein n=1 Tax=Catenovulum agarivorans TaxID=1172192 RepID=UPI000304A823|nr:DUF4382 domain-containing protein [Catenovulum agarivorans]
MKTLTYKLSSLALVVGLSACGSSSVDISNGSDDSAQFSLSVSDAAVEGATEVNIFAKQVTLRSAGGEDTVFATLDENDQPIKINLLDFQGSQAYQLISNEEVDLGNYEWLRIDVVNGDENDLTNTSHVVFPTETRPLVVERKGNDGVGEIQLDGFNLNQGNNEFVAEFDLKRSLVDPKNPNDDSIKLKPRGVRLQNLTDAANLMVTVDSALIGTCESDFAASASELDSSFGHSVYVYSSGTTADNALDINADDDSVSMSPVATANLTIDDVSGDYIAEIGFLGEGNYALAYTCLSHLDDAETIDDEVVIYAFKTSIDVTGDASTSVISDDLVYVAPVVETTE